MNNFSKVKRILNEASDELSSKLLFYNEFIDVHEFKIKILNNLENENIEIDCTNNVIYINEGDINSTSLKSSFKHKLLHAYLYHATDIDLKRLSLDTSYLFIFYCLATDTDPGYIAKNTLYYDLALEAETLIKNKPYLVDLIYLNINKKEKETLKELNILAESEYLRIKGHNNIFNINCKDSAIKVSRIINYINNTIYHLDFYRDEHELFSHITAKENA